MSEQLHELLREQTQKPGHKVLLCGEDVLDWCRQELRAPASFAQIPDQYKLMQISIQLAGDSPPRAWRLILHDKCEVVYPEDSEGQPLYDQGSVRHGDCTIVEEGSL